MLPRNRFLEQFGFKNIGHLSSVQSLSDVQLFVTPWTTASQASLSITNSWSLFKLMSTESVMPSNHLILLSFWSLASALAPVSCVLPATAVPHG